MRHLEAAGSSQCAAAAGSASRQQQRSSGAGGRGGAHQEQGAQELADRGHQDGLLHSQRLGACGQGKGKYEGGWMVGGGLQRGGMPKVPRAGARGAGAEGV